ncbi:MAG: hypothetical protein EP336_12345 [Rhodobacteraceae bacterium]|nr:MAG: hypothetical protein EP336_12345 [Paracoccaceae bacterium]
MLEELLRKAVFESLKPNNSTKKLFGPESNLGLTALAEHAHAHGLIGDSELSALRHLAKIRNKIAHSWSADFSHTEIQKEAQKLPIIQLRSAEENEPHQIAFSRTNYLGIHLIPEFFNRFQNLKSFAENDFEFLSTLKVDVNSGEATASRNRNA